MNTDITVLRNSIAARQSRGYSKIYATLLLFLIVLTAFITGCKKDDFNGEVIGVCPVVSTDPADKAVNVALNKVISATFNTSMKSAGINATSFIIKKGTTQIAGNIAPVTGNSAVFTFDPDADLEPFEEYTGTIKAGVRDTLNTAMVSDYVWTFKTIPQLTTVAGANGSVGVAGTTNIVGLHNQGSSVPLLAIPNTGFRFVGWTIDGGAVSPLASFSYTMNGNKTIVANFAATAGNVVLTTSARPGGSVNPNGVGSYPLNTVVQVTATANAGFVFTGWSGDATGSANPLSVTMNGPKNIIANFGPTGSSPALFSSIFGAFGLAGITNQGIFTVINNGSIGTTGASTTVTGFHDMTGDKYIETPLNIGNVKDGRIYTDGPPPVIFAAGGPYGGNATTKAVADAGLLAATNFRNSISPANRPGGTVQAQQLGGLTLPPGTYISQTGPFDITSGDLTLNGDQNAVWVFQAPSSLTVGAVLPRSVKLTGGAQAKNVYWYVGSAATINYAGGGVMTGTILASEAVTLSSPANSTNTLVQTVLNGRAISIAAGTTMVNTIINVPAP